LYMFVQKNPVSIPPIFMDLCGAFGTTGWRRCIECLKLQVISRKRATNSRALLRKMTYKDKASYGSSPPCTQSGGHTRIAKPLETSLYLCKRALHIRHLDNGSICTEPVYECDTYKRVISQVLCVWVSVCVCVCMCTCVCVCVCVTHINVSFRR